MKKRKRITPEMIAKLSPEERKEFLLLLEVESRPKLARIYQPSSPQPFDANVVREALEAGINAKVIAGTRTHAEQNAIYAQGSCRSGHRAGICAGGHDIDVAA